MLATTPTIEIHFADDIDQDTAFEITPLRSPYSPKCPSPMAYSDSDADDFRPVHLLPPPAAVSPVRPGRPTLPADKKGLDHARFEQLLKHSREGPLGKFHHTRSNSAELRRQATLKAHTAKALERRALFLSKIGQPASPTATESPATPPESPAIFHFRLPSPGLQSPLSVAVERKKAPVAFPSEPEREIETVMRVEEVDYKSRARTTSIRNGRSPVVRALTPCGQPHLRHGRRASANSLPSLDQITARLVKTSPPSPPNDLAPIKEGLTCVTTSLRVTNTHKRSPSSSIATSAVSQPTSQIVLPVAGLKSVTAPAAPTSRLPAFLQNRNSTRTPSPTPTIIVSAPSPAEEVPPVQIPTVDSPIQVVRTRRHLADNLTLFPPPRSSSLGRSAPARSGTHPTNRPVTPERRKQTGLDMLEKLRRRSSAPATLPARPKDDHPVLKMRGGF